MSPRTLLAMLVATLLAIVGCSSDASTAGESRRMTDAERQAFREAWGSGAGPGAVSHPQSVAVASGPAPLAYITEQAGSVWVTDNAGRQWGPVPVGARTVVRVVEETGVAVGSQRLDRGPLPEGRTYTINLGVPEEKGWWNGTRGGQVGAPAGISR